MKMQAKHLFKETLGCILTVSCLVLLLAFFCVLGRHAWEEYRNLRGLPKHFRATAAVSFYGIQQRVFPGGQGVSRDANETDPSSSAAAAWEEYLRSSSLRDFSDIESFSVERTDSTSLYHANIRGSLLEQMIVAIPSESVDDYVAVGFASCEFNSKSHPIVFAYSPSASNRVFSAYAGENTDLTEVLSRTIRNHNWSQPFNPSVEDWPYFYPVGEDHHPLGRLTARVKK